MATEIIASTGNPGVQVRALDLADLGSVAAFAAGWDGPLHVLVNNAGVMDLPEQRTPAAWEMQFATIHLGHFALALGLHDALAADGAARVVSLSSSGHNRSPVVFDDLFFERRPYDPKLAYGQSKTANVLFAVEASRHWAADGITSNAVMPGGIWTSLQRHWDDHPGRPPVQRLPGNRNWTKDQVPRARRGHLCLGGHLPRASRGRRPLPRRLPPS